jgi:hypothetical protein
MGPALRSLSYKRMTSGFASAKKSGIRELQARLMFQFRTRWNWAGNTQPRAPKSPVSISYIAVTTSGTLGSCTPMVAITTYPSPLQTKRAELVAAAAGPLQKFGGIQRDGPDRVCPMALSTNATLMMLESAKKTSA